MKKSAVGLIVVFALLAMLRPASADVLLLTNGKRIEGELLNPKEKPRKTYVVKLAIGGQISLDAAQVKQLITTRPELVEYEKVRPEYPDTVDGQMKLAEWCREKGLETQRKTHLKRVIELDPDHARARQLLGYGKIDGQWMTHDESMAKQGYVRYKNQWKLPQEIEILENQRKQEAAEVEWFQKIERWRHWLDRNDKKKIAKENFAKIEDPVAVKALAAKLQREPSQEVRLLYIEALGKLGTPSAYEALAVRAIEDTVEEVRLTCLDVLEKTKSAKVVDYFVTRLRDKNNKVVNRAAVGLARMKSSSSVRPLIAALVTTHKEVIGSGPSGGQSMSMGFPTGGSSSGGGGGISQGFGGSGGPKVVKYQLQNQAVLDALVTITGQNFSFDQRAWRTWYATQNKAQPLDARRG